MTISELNQKLIQTTDHQIYNDALIEAALTVQDEMSDRIFEKLENIAGKKASSSDYSTKEIWVEPLTLPRQAGSATGKRGTPIKTRYFAGGWAQVKKDVGRLNYKLNNVFFMDFNSPLINFGGDLRVALILKKPEWSIPRISFFVE